MYLKEQKIETGWRLKTVPFNDAKAVQNGTEWNALPAPCVPARVPGDWPLDLVRAGLLPDPYFGDNFLRLTEYESHHVFYYTTFSWTGSIEDVFLRFDGIDTIADIYLNGKKIGHAENMFIEHEFFADGLREGENELIVQLLPVCVEAKKHDLAGAVAFKYNDPSLVFRKAAHSFGWDICPRIVGGGLWKGVSAVQKRKNRINSVFLSVAELSDGAAKLKLSYDTEIGDDLPSGYSIKIEGKCDESVFFEEKELKSLRGECGFTVANPKLWWVRGYGKPNLYDVRATLTHNGEIADEYAFRYGIRTAELIRDEITTKEKPGRFLFRINNKDIYIMGTNWVPCDAFHSRDRERMPAILDLALDCGCNALRVWGGGVYESDDFYDLCDEKGVFVWQDFMMACAVYPQTDRMKDQLREEAISVVRRLRNHPSLCVWAGDNECDLAYSWFGRRNPEENLLTRKVLPEVLEKEDGSRPYLPSSPHISGEAAKKGMKTPEQHLWGPRKYFKGKFYRNHTAIFASEMGYHGCNSVGSIEKFIPKEYLWPYKNNKMWLYHASSPELKNSPYTYRIGLMARQIRCFFGETPRSLNSFSAMSQIVQAEAVKYFVESFRCRKGRRTGLIWWNIMDCWPQFSDAVVDYYFDKKPAYYYIRNSQQPLCLMMDKTGSRAELFAVSDLNENTETRYTVSVNGKIIARGKGTAIAGQSVSFGSFNGRGRKFFVIRWETADGKTGRNHFLCGRPIFSYRWYKKQMEDSGLLDYIKDGANYKQGSDDDEI